MLAGEMIEDALQGLNPVERDALIASLQTIRSNLSSVPEGKEAANG